MLRLILPNIFEKLKLVEFLFYLQLPDFSWWRVWWPGAGGWDRSVNRQRLIDQIFCCSVTTKYFCTTLPAGGGLLPLLLCLGQYLSTFHSQQQEHGHNRHQGRGGIDDDVLKQEIILVFQLKYFKFYGLNIFRDAETGLSAWQWQWRQNTNQLKQCFCCRSFYCNSMTKETLKCVLKVFGVGCSSSYGLNNIKWCWFERSNHFELS